MVFLGGVTLIKILGDPWLLRTQRELLITRSSSKGKANKSWDMILAPLVALSSLGISVVAGLDERFGWSSFERAWVVWVGLGFLVLSGMMIFWSTRWNASFDGTVNIQEGHRVAMQGPYRLVRHPGYVGMFFMFPSIPLVLDSMIAYIPAAFFVLALWLRTLLEDGTLMKELPGYAGYAQKVKFRMFPNIW
jgi:protein-S-isoprenylcysteine O-methyltransferase Ste14